MICLGSSPVLTRPRYYNHGSYDVMNYDEQMNAHADADMH